MGKVGPNGLYWWNLVGPVPVAPELLQNTGIPLRFAPEAPKLKKTWVKKQGPIGDYFKDFVQQLAQQYIHTQLDKLTTDIHRHVATGVDGMSAAPSVCIYIVDIYICVCLKI